MSVTRWLIAIMIAIGLVGAAPLGARADGFVIILQPMTAGGTTITGAVRNVPPGTVTVKVELFMKSGGVRAQSLDVYSNGVFLFRDVPTGSWTRIRATAEGGVAEQSTEVGPESAAVSNGYGDGSYQGYNGPYYFPGYLGVNGSGYTYPGNYGMPSYSAWGNPGTYFYPGSFANPGYYSYPGAYYYPGYAFPGSTYSYGGYSPAWGYPYGSPGAGYPGYSYPGYGYPTIGYPGISPWGYPYR